MARLGAFVCAALVALSVVEATYAVDRLVPSQYATIQAAINAAVAGDQVVVSPGTYVGQISMGGKAITLRSTGGSAVTTLSPGSAGGAVVYCTSAETSACIIQGFTITGATNGPGVAIVTASPVFKFCEIKQNLNSSSNGAGVSVSGTTGTPRFEDCFIFGNYANAREGGGISCTLSGSGASLTCVRCTFQQNEVVNASHGGAVHIAGSHSSFQAAFTDCVFRLNTITATDGNRYGGAIYSTAPLTLSGCTFDRNSVLQSVGSVGGDVHSRGGAVYCSNSVSATDCAFLQNVARSTPNLYCCGGASYARGGAFYLDSAAVASFLRCSFTQNSALQPLASCGGSRVAQGGALFCGSGADPVITTCSFTGNRAEMCSGGQGGAIAYDGGSEGAITNSTFSACYAGSTGGALQIYSGAGPLVVGCTFSNCTTPNTGLGGAVRLDGGGVLSTFRDCRFTNCSAGSGGAAWVANTRPTFDKCVFDHNTAPSGSAIFSGGTGILNIPIVCYSNFCSNSGTSSNWISGSFTDAHPTSPTNSFSADCGTDCNANGIVDAVEIAAGLSDCDHNGIPDTCEPDCDGDAIPNRCEILAGAPDCDSNGVPDSCQGILSDINHDGLPDLCQGLEFTGLTTELVPAVAAGSGLPAGALCWRVYANFSTTTALVNAIIGRSTHPLSVNAVGGFWQLSSSEGDDLSSQVACTGGVPGAAFDSFFAINRDCANGNNPPLQAGGDIDFTSFNNGGGLLVNSTDGGAIVALAGDGQTLFAGTDKRVLLLQLTTNQPNQPFGFLNLMGFDSLGREWQAFDMAIPSPPLVDCNGNGIHDTRDIAAGTSSDCDHDGIPDSCQWGTGGDCDANGVPDYCQLAAGAPDINNNDRLDVCECVGDVDGNGAVNVDDLIEVIVTWGDTVSGQRDLDFDHVVNAGDLILVLNSWGSCNPITGGGTF